MTSYEVIMGDVVNIEDLKKQQSSSDEKTTMVNALVSLAARVEAGEVIGVTFAAIRVDHEVLSISAMQVPGCGFHELVGAANILAEHLTAATRP
jgi:hypothetical protein